MSTRWKEGTQISTEKEVDINIGALVYMDDSTWVGKSESDLRQSLDIAEEFFELNDIQINTKKTKLIVINTKKNKKEKERRTTRFVKDTIIAEDPNSAIRLLGVWINEVKGKKAQKWKIRWLIEEGTRLIQRSMINQEIARYLINQVLLPAVEYLMIDLILSKGEANRLQAKLQSAFKRKANLAKSVTNELIQNKEGFQIFSIWDRQFLNTSKRFKRILEDKTGMGTTAIIRLRQEQTRRGREENIFGCEAVPTRKGRKSTHNHSVEMLELLKSQNCTFMIGLTLQEIFKSGNYGTTVASVLGKNLTTPEQTSINGGSNM